MSPVRCGQLGAAFSPPSNPFCQFTATISSQDISTPEICCGYNSLQGLDGECQRGVAMGGARTVWVGEWAGCQRLAVVGWLCPERRTGSSSTAGDGAEAGQAVASGGFPIWPPHYCGCLCALALSWTSSLAAAMCRASFSKATLPWLSKFCFLKCCHSATFF